MGFQFCAVLAVTTLDGYRIGFESNRNTTGKIKRQAFSTNSENSPENPPALRPLITVVSKYVTGNRHFSRGSRASATHTDSFAFVFGSVHSRGVIRCDGVRRSVVTCVRSQKNDFMRKFREKSTKILSAKFAPRSFAWADNVFVPRRYRE